MAALAYSVSLKSLDAIFGGSFLPSSLFSAGEQGAWYDPSDFSTMFQDSVGTTPVTAVEQPVGLILDKSKGLALGSELVPDTDFNASASWTPETADWVVSGGKATYTKPGAGIQYLQSNDNISIVNGTWYKLTFTISGIASGSAIFGLFNKAASVNYLGAYQTISANGTYSVYFLATSSTTGIRIYGNASGTATSWSFESFGIKSIAGNHASQSTSASRPVLSARVNLLTYSEQFDNAAWQKTNMTVAAIGISDPFGGTAASTIKATTTNSANQTYQSNNTVPVGVSTLFSIWVRRRTGSGTVRLKNQNGSDFTNITSSLTTSWQRFTLTSVPNANGFFYPGITVETLNDEVDVYGADLRVTNDGVGIPAYQRVAAATDYDTSGFPLYLRFDGTDDCLATATISPGGDKLQVFAGVRKIAGTGFQAAVGYGFTTAGSFYLYAPTPVKADYGFYATGNIGTNTKFTDATFTPPISSVVSGFVDGALAQATQVTARVNGSSAALSAGGAMTLTSIGADKINLGRRQNSDLPFNGNLYSIIFRFGANLSDAQIASTETYVNNLTKAY